MWWLYLIIGVAAFFLGIVFVISTCPTLGTLYIDLNSKDDKDVARVIFDKTLEESSRYGLMFIRIKKQDNLSSLDGRI